MPDSDSSYEFGESLPREFNTTHWSVVLAAGQTGSDAAHAALESLCRTYWYPLYAHVRRRGLDAHAAQDLTQEFFARLLDRNGIATVDRTKGKFRSFLLASMDNFLTNAWRDSHTQKRGGHLTFISLENQLPGEPALQAPSGELLPEQLFAKQWAMTLLETVLAELQCEFTATGKGQLFDTLKIFLTGEKRSAGYAELALNLATTEGALKMTVQRLRKRYAELLRAEVARTVASPDEVEEELRALFAALSV